MEMKEFGRPLLFLATGFASVSCADIVYLLLCVNPKDRWHAGVDRRICWHETKKAPATVAAIRDYVS